MPEKQYKFIRIRHAGIFVSKTFAYPTEIIDLNIFIRMLYGISKNLDVKPAEYPLIFLA